MPWRPAVELQQGEEVVLELGIPFAAVAPGIILTLGLAEPARRTRKFVVTTRRVIVLLGPPGARKVSSVPLSRVQDAAVVQRLWQGRVAITSAGGQAGRQMVGPMMVSEARAFAQAVLERAGTGAPT